MSTVGIDVFSQKFYDSDGTTVLPFDNENLDKFKGFTFEGVAGEGKLVKVSPTHTYTATLHFDANGGINPPADLTDTVQQESETPTGEKIFNIPPTVPTRTGYNFLGWSDSPTGSVIYIPKPSEPNAYYYSVPVPYGSTVTLYAVWEVQTFTVTITAGAGGSVTPTTLTVPYNSTFSANGNVLTVNGTTVTATPGDHYHFANWSKTSGSITANTTITATFAIDTFTVTIERNGTGSVDKHTVTVAYNVTWSTSGNVLTFSDGQEVTATPSAHYHVTGWSPASGTITADTMILVDFAADTYTVTITAGAGGTVSPTKLTVFYGSSFSTSGNILTVGGYTVTATPNAHYHFADWSEASGSITADTTITANFAIDTYTISFIEGTGGSIDKSTVSVAYGTTWTSSGNILTFSDGQKVTATPSANRHTVWNPASGTVTSDSTITITVTFTLDTYTVTISAGSNGTVTPTTLTVAYGTTWTSSGNTLTVGSQEVTATPNAHYHTVWSPASGTVTGATTITANFAIDTYTVTIKTSGTGSVDKPAVTVAYGSTISALYNVLTVGATKVTATPNAHYHFVSWSQTSGTITANTTITANFAIDTFTVSFVTSTGGIVDKPAVTVAYGSTISASGNVLTVGGQTVTATANDGYHFGSWSQTSGTITGATTIKANFTASGTVSFDMMGGVDGPATITVDIVEGSPTQVEIPNDVPTRDWYVFNGWSAIPGGPVAYHAGDVITLTIDKPTTTLYAVWSVSPDLQPDSSKFEGFLTAMIVLCILGTISGLGIAAVINARRGN